MSVKGSSLLATLLVLGLCAGTSAQDPGSGDIFTVYFPQDVVIGDRIVPPGYWDIRWEGTKSEPTMKFYQDNVLNMEVPVFTVTSQNDRKRATSEAVIERMGADYYLTNVWIEGEKTGHAIRLLPQTAGLQHGEVQYLPAKFVSASRFSQGAWMEGQARSHVGQGLGGPEDRNMTGVVVARSFSPSLPGEGALVENRPLPDTRSFPAEPISEARPGAQPPDQLAAADPEIVRTPPEIVQPVTPAPEVEQPQIAAAPPPIEPVLSNRDETRITPDPGVESNVAQTPVVTEPPQSEPPIDTAAAGPAEPLPTPPAITQGQDPAALPEQLPATASNWPESLLIGCALIGLALLVHRS